MKGTLTVPIYEYQCNACGETFEVFLNASDKPVKKCEYCKSTKIQKLISNCSFQLKGTGWYATDYANKDKNSAGKTKKKDDEKGSTETKAAADTSSSSKTSDSASDKKPAAGTADNKAA